MSNKEEVGESSVNLSAIAVAHWQSVLLDKKSSDTAKSNAANGLASHDIRMKTANRGQIIRMSRSELTQEIARMRALLA